MSVLSLEKFLGDKRLTEEEKKFLEKIIRPEIGLREDFAELIDDYRVSASEKKKLMSTLKNGKASYTEDQISLILTRFKVILDNREKYSYSFPIGEYGRRSVDHEGIIRIENLNEMTKQLALAAISRKPEVLKKAFEFFDQDLFANIRENLPQIEIFKQIGKYLKKNNLSDQEAQVILSTLRDRSNGNNRKLNEIVNFVERGILNPNDFAKYQSLVARVNVPSLDLTRSFGKNGCCAFWGTGERDPFYQFDLHSRYHASNLYLADPEVGLLFLHIEENGKLSHPVGSAIMAMLRGIEIEGMDSGRNLRREITPRENSDEKNYILVDSIETYRPEHDHRFQDDMPLRKTRPTIWHKLMMNGLINLAKETERDGRIDGIFYNPEFWNEGGNTFTEYFIKNLKEKNFEVEKRKMLFRKALGRSCIPEDFQDKFGYFFDALMPPTGTSGWYSQYDSYHAIRGSREMSGEAIGYLIRRPNGGWEI